MTLKNLYDYIQSLLKQLELAQQEINKTRMTLLNSITECEKLKKCINKLKNHCKVFESFFNKIKM